MATSDLYTQCKIKNDDGYVDVVWLPHTIVKKTKNIVIDGRGAWRILETYATESIENIDALRSVHKRFVGVLENA